MRAWLFVLAVLATFQPIVQVASTGELVTISSLPSSASSLPYNITAKEEEDGDGETAAATETATSATVQDPHTIVSNKESRSPWSIASVLVSSTSSGSRSHQKQQQQSKQIKLHSRDKGSDRDSAKNTQQTASQQRTSSKMVNILESNSISSSSNIYRINSKSNELLDQREDHVNNPVHQIQRTIDGDRLENNDRQDQVVRSSDDRGDVVDDDKVINTKDGDIKDDAEEDEDQEDIQEPVVEEEQRMTREKPDPQTLVAIEKNLLSLFGFKKRPKVDRSKVVIPQAMRQLYAELMGHELELVNLPKQGLDSKSANTVRSFTHEGESSLCFYLF